MTTKFTVFTEQRELGQRCRLAGFTRFEIAEGLLVSPATVNGWLTGYNRMPAEMRALIECRLRAVEAERLAQAEPQR